MPTSEDIAAQQIILASHRRTLSHYLDQRARLGKDHISSGVAHGIDDARAEIRRIKGVLRGWGEKVEDLPDDEEPPSAGETRKKSRRLQTSEEKIRLCYNHLRYLEEEFLIKRQKSIGNTIIMLLKIELDYIISLLTEVSRSNDRTSLVKGSITVIIEKLEEARRLFWTSANTKDRDRIVDNLIQSQQCIKDAINEFIFDNS